MIHVFSLVQFHVPLSYGSTSQRCCIINLTGCLPSAENCEVVGSLQHLQHLAASTCSCNGAVLIAYAHSMCHSLLCLVYHTLLLIPFRMRETYMLCFMSIRIFGVSWCRSKMGGWGTQSQSLSLQIWCTTFEVIGLATEFMIEGLKDKSVTLNPKLWVVNQG
jgi:hypothetical protein